MNFKNKIFFDKDVSLDELKYKKVGIIGFLFFLIKGLIWLAIIYGLGDFFIDFIYLNFWKRNLDIEKIEVIENVFKKIGAKSSGFKDWKEKEGINRLQNTMDYAHKNGVFGVPSYFILDELYWGREQLPLIQARITGNYDKVI